MSRNQEIRPEKLFTIGYLRCRIILKALIKTICLVRENPVLILTPEVMESYPNWILNGEKGISFKKNMEIANIDYSSAHLYSEAWDIKNGAEWIFDHNSISKSYNKPFLLGEYGANNNRQMNFNSWLKAIKETSSGGALLWQLTPRLFRKMMDMY